MQRAADQRRASAARSAATASLSPSTGRRFPPVNRPVLVVRRRRRRCRGRLRSLDPRHRCDHLRDHVLMSCNEEEGTPRHEGGRRAVPQRRHLLLVVHPDPRALRLLHRAHHAMLLQLDAGAHRQRAGSACRSARDGATRRTRTAAASPSPHCSRSTSRRWTCPSSMPRSFRPCPNLDGIQSNNASSRSDLLLRPGEVPMNALIVLAAVRRLCAGRSVRPGRPRVPVEDVACCWSRRSTRRAARHRAF